MGKHLMFVWLYVSVIKTGSRRIIRLDQLTFVVRLQMNPLFIGLFKKRKLNRGDRHWASVGHRVLRFFLPVINDDVK